MTTSFKGATRRLLINSLGGNLVPKLFHRKVVPSHFTILMYHGVVTTPLPVEHPCFITRRQFDRQLRYLKHNCQVLRLETALRMAAQGDIDRPSVVITFDDGFQNNFDVAFPLLRRYELPATIFLTTGFIGTDNTLWSCRLHDAVQATPKRSVRWQGRVIDLDSAEDRARASRYLRREFKGYAHSKVYQELERVLKIFEADPTQPISESSPFRMLGREEVEIMSSSELISFGAHTDSHVILSRVKSSVKRKEINMSLRKVADWTGEVCRLFAYPNGQPEDYDKESVDILNNRGVEAAVTTASGGNTVATPRLELRRYGVDPNTDMNTFRLRVHHLLPYTRNLVLRALGR